MHPLLKTLLPCLWASLIITQLTAAPTLSIEAKIQHDTFHTLLQRYVNPQGRINYKQWHTQTQDIQQLKNYIQQFAPIPQTPAQGDDEIASLINVYNAITLLWILNNYPTNSIRKTSQPWKAQRWTLGGKPTSLNDIEHKNLRPLIGWKAHGVLVCAARSCPPLSNTAYQTKDLDPQIKQRFTLWLSRKDLNHFDPPHKRAYLSKIFSWYYSDFEDNTTLTDILKKFAPPAYTPLFQDKYSIRYLKYNWGLNDQGTLGDNY